MENQASDFNVSSNGRKEKRGLGVLAMLDGGCQIRGFVQASVVCHLLYFYSFFFFSSESLSEKAMSVRSSSWLRLVSYLLFIFVIIFVYKAPNVLSYIAILQ